MRCLSWSRRVTTASDGGLQKVNVGFRCEKIKPLRGTKRQRWRLKSGCVLAGQGRFTGDVFFSFLSIKRLRRRVYSSQRSLRNSSVTLSLAFLAFSLFGYGGWMEPCRGEHLSPESLRTTATKSGRCFMEGHRNAGTRRRQLNS